MPSIADIKQALSDGKITMQDIDSNGWLASVTHRISKVRQPRGGYINPNRLTKTQLAGGGIDDLAEENVSPNLVGSAVERLTRLMCGASAEEAFATCRRGAEKVDAKSAGTLEFYDTLLAKVVGLDDESIYAAILLTGFESAWRAGMSAYRDVQDIAPDEATIKNVRTMVERSVRFFEAYGPVVLSGLTFEGAHTGYIASGDGDFLTADTLWDFKVSKQKPLPKYTLQLLVYWRMGLHSVHPEYKDVRYLGIFNPRTNTVFRIDVSELDEKMIEEVERDVIGYDA